MEVTLNLQQVIAAQDELEKEARELFGYDTTVCSSSKGAVNQSLWSCKTCAQGTPTCTQINRNAQVTGGEGEGVGICAACAVSCHASHDLVELFVRRNFMCDCGTTRMNGRCEITKRRGEVPASGNLYDRCFKGEFCNCGKIYDPETEEDDMIQCHICQDWFHSNCLPPLDPSTYDSLICSSCVSRTPLLLRYAGAPRSGVLLVNEESEEIFGEVEEISGDLSLDASVAIVTGPIGNNHGVGTNNDQHSAAPSTTGGGGVGLPTGTLKRRVSDASSTSGSLYASASASASAKGSKRRRLSPQSFTTDDSISLSNRINLTSPSTSTSFSDLTGVSVGSASASRFGGGMDEMDSRSLAPTSPGTSVTFASSSVAVGSTVSAMEGLDVQQRQAIGQNQVQGQKRCTAPPMMNGGSGVYRMLKEKGAKTDVFLVEGWRSRWCRCEDCVKQFEGLEFLLVEEEVWEPPEDKDAHKSLLELGSEALTRLPRDQTLDGLRLFNDMRDRLKKFLKPLADSGETVTDVHVSKFFEMEKERTANVDQK